jgi:hypothetical protein
MITKNYLFFIVLIAGLLVSACGKNEKELHYVVNTVTETVDEIARLVKEINDARSLQGQAPLVPGLVCSLYNNTGVGGVFPTGSSTFPATLPAKVTSFVYIGDINQPDSSASAGLNLLPEALRPLYTSWYAVQCTGQLVITSPDYYSFSLRSDDVGLFYINNSLVTGLNTLHSPTTTTGVRYLNRGIHSIRLDFMQATGQQSLQLNIPGSQFYR